MPVSGTSRVTRSCHCGCMLHSPRMTPQLQWFTVAAGFISAGGHSQRYSLPNMPRFVLETGWIAGKRRLTVRLTMRLTERGRLAEGERAREDITQLYIGSRREQKSREPEETERRGR